MGTIIWAIIGFALLIAEMISGTFYLLFFGISALIITILKIFSFNNLPIEIILFATIGILSAFLLRKRLINNKTKNVEPDINQILVAGQDIEPNDEVTITYQGSLWRAVNIGSQRIKQGERMRIVKTQGNKLLVVREYSSLDIKD